MLVWEATMATAMRGNVRSGNLYDPVCGAEGDSTRGVRPMIDGSRPPRRNPTKQAGQLPKEPACPVNLDDGQNATNGPACIPTLAFSSTVYTLRP